MLEMNMFNELISDLDLTDVPFSGKEFTWSNMQAQPLLVKLDWVLTSASWPLSYPATHVQPLSRPISDHIPYVIHIGSNIPKANVFIFENYWMEHPGFMENVIVHWNNSPMYANAAKNIASKLKHVRARLRKWSRNLSNLNKLIYNSNWVLMLMDGLEEQRSLSRLESAFIRLVKSHLATLLESKRVYWKQRNTIRWVTLGDENSSYFHAIATISHKKNFIVSISGPDGDLITNHDQKANLFWEAYKDRLGCSELTLLNMI